MSSRTAGLIVMVCLFISGLSLGYKLGECNYQQPTTPGSTGVMK